ncbi:S9 family peptidase [Pseudochrobactrum sp. B5]|uniref:S9 family peptidase n=1 Tax=Pseudochrobactrum sp. B5 TaxID=1289478 RepID=UPI00095190D9|nr:S9 family peptidase [Pseudochrobactrum sp. B5]
MTTTNIPAIEALFGIPLFSRAQVSPDGINVAYLAPWSGRLNIWVRPVDAAFAHEDAKRLTGDDTRNVESFCWTPDGKYILFVQDTKGDENWHLHRVDVDGTTADLTPFPGVRVISLELSTDRPGKAFVQMNYRSPEFIDLYEIDIDTGALNTVAENPGRYVGWIIVPGGKLHTLIINERGDYELARYEHGWFTAVATFKGHDYPLGPMPIRATPDGKAILIGSNTGTDRTRLARIDLATGTETEIDSHPSYSLDTPRPEADPRYPSSLIVNPVTGQLLGARYLGERQVIHPLDPNFASVLERLRVLSDNDLGHISCDAIGRRWVVEFTDDRHPGTTWFYDHATGESRLLGERHPDMVPDRFARVRPVTVKSRDDLDIPCHVTLPVDVPPRHLPTVLLVHGGPWYRDACVYDPEVQFLASRGYAVLQVNFRGSTGYGKSFTQAAIGEFAGRMHDDLIDGLDWLIDEGIADRERVTIYGCSYGGYSALIGASFTPERFAAAIDYSGMSDLRSLVEGAVPFVYPALVNNYIAYMGDPAVPEQNADMLARSPASRLDCIRKPLLVIHGTNDVRVAKAQADAVVEAVRRNGVEVEYLVNEREGHWFINQDSNFELYRTLERFLSRHLGNEGGRTDA